MKKIKLSKAGVFALFGLVIGIILSIILLFLEHIDIMFYLSAAPYYLDQITIKSSGLVSVVTFVYFGFLFSLVGYLIGKKFSAISWLIIFILVITLHFRLASLGGHNLFGGLFKALESLGTRN